MKKLYFIMLTTLSSFALTSCEVEVHLGGESTYVPWYVVGVPTAVFVTVVLTVTHISIVKQSYICPKCGKVFSPKWYELSSWLHINSDRIMRCPACGRRGFCRRQDLR